ncbi:XRE family transcriptional regulator, partial [Kingella kingae]|uniref:XRE family transcriptional regulator n=1 Tax=Kingella kingae TaxID=504 RepID=UPI001E2BD236
RHLAALSQKGLSDAMGWSESKVSRMKDGDLDELCAAPASRLDLKIVPLDACVVTPHERKFMAEQMILHYQNISDE